MSKKQQFYSNLYVKRRLLKLEIDIFGIIAQGLDQHTPKMMILKQIQKEIRSVQASLHLTVQEANAIYANAVTYYTRVSKQTFAQLRKLDKQQKQELRMGVIYSASRALIQDDLLIKNANQVMYSYEQRKKHDSIWGEDGLIAASRADSSRAYSPFFICSSHPKPAKDHADWEGKVYYDEAWEDQVDDPDVASSIRAYIRNHKLRSLQWVVGAPVYLCTRRNCKHFMIHLDLEEVLHSSRRKILKQHNLYMEDEEPASERLLSYRRYYGRLKLEEELYKVIPNDELEKDLKKDKNLLDKYK